MNSNSQSINIKCRSVCLLWVFLLVTILLPGYCGATVEAQSIISTRYSPESSDFLGHLKYYSKLDFEYSKIIYQNNGFIYHPSLRISVLNFHQGNHAGYTDKYGVRPGQRFGAVGVLPGSFSECLYGSPVYFDEAVGIAYFPRRFPNYNGRNLNIILEAGIHVRIMKVILLGYRYSHVSNVWTGRINPGLDSNMLSLGVILR